jgi:hypothetical protein
MVSLTTTLALIQQYLTVALGVLLVVGVVGNVLNCCVFIQKRLRSNPCSVFFTAASMANITVLIQLTIHQLKILILFIANFVYTYEMLY